jgi:hypothetical protein
LPINGDLEFQIYNGFMANSSKECSAPLERVCTWEIRGYKGYAPTERVHVEYYKSFVTLFNKYRNNFSTGIFIPAVPIGLKGAIFQKLFHSRGHGQNHVFFARGFHGKTFGLGHLPLKPFLGRKGVGQAWQSFAGRLPIAIDVAGGNYQLKPAAFPRFNPSHAVEQDFSVLVVAVHGKHGLGIGLAERKPVFLWPPFSRGQLFRGIFISNGFLRTCPDIVAIGFWVFFAGHAYYD